MSYGYGRQRGKSNMLGRIILFVSILTVLNEVIKTTAAAALNSNTTIDGNWSPWSTYSSTCSKPCGGGVHIRYRSCSDPAPSNGGVLCEKLDGTGVSKEDAMEEPCNTHSCRTGNYTEWEECENCTIGIQKRYALCGENETDICTGNQYLEEEEPCNRWDKATCPSPCIGVDCPEPGMCHDISTDVKPLTECKCVMGYTLDNSKTRCIRPPPPIPTKRPIPVLPEEEKAVAVVVSKTASTVLIVFVGLTLALFMLLRIFDHDRIIQMNMEIALIIAHIFLLLPAETYENVEMCKVVSIFIHFFFTACFCFMMLESLHMYSMVAYVVKKNGMLSTMQNMVFGWGIPLLVIIFNICFEYDNYGGEYHCWLRMDTPLMIGQIMPILIIVIITLTLIEAAGAAEYKPLPDVDQKQLMSAQISQRTNLIILPFVASHMVIGMISEYEQSLPLYSIFSILNAVTGVLIFVLHCSNNQQVRGKLKQFWKSCKGSG